MRSCAALSKRGVIFRPMTRRSNCSISSCVRSRRIGKCRRGNGRRRKRNSPSCSTHGSSQHDGQPAPHTKYLTVPPCTLKPRCSPNAPARKIPRSIHEGARNMARDIAKTDAYLTSRRERKKIEMLFAHLKRILQLGRLRLRGPNGARDEFHLAATAQNLRKLAGRRSD